ncbi:MAG TPA: flagellar basal body P-ring protein FlgI [Phycisphaerae bacterium]|nr:flagellar basal body P-ring protein FlgI [Phycisphaerae bacterium]
MSSPSRTAACALTLAALAAALTGCASRNTRAGKPGVDPQDAISARTYPTLHGTIAEYATVANAQPTIVEGIGLVAGLPNTGSSDMPPNVRALLTADLYTYNAGSYIYGTQDIVPERILSTNQIAAVEIRGVIPPLARKGSTFDIEITALPNTQTTSLANGLLWTSELKLAGTDLQSHAIALARGPVFIPNAVERLAGSGGATAGADALVTRKVLRSGRIVGGGTVTEDNPIELQLFSPGLGKSQVIERAINAKFPGIDRVADAQNESVIDLNVPAEYRDRPGEFIEFVKHIYLRQDVPGFNEQKAAELVKDFADPHAPRRDLSLALEGLGRSILPDYIEPQYTSPDPAVRFWCARAGAGMQDVGGMVVLQEFVNDTSSPFHEQAISALTEVSRGDTARASLTLSKLLTSTDTAERIRAYMGLCAIHSRLVRHYTVGQNFFLDVLPSDSPPLIYVSQSGAQRIALIGRTIELPAGALYISPDNLLTVNVMAADPASAAASPASGAGVLTASMATDAASAAASQAPSQNVMLYWRAPQGDKTVDLRTSTDMPAILARLGYIPDPHSADYDPSQKFIGVSYQRVVEMLAGMVKEHLIDATFALEKSPEILPTSTELVSQGRPEGSTTPATRPADPAIAPMPPAGAVDSHATPIPAPAAAPTLAPLPLGN